MKKKIYVVALILVSSLMIFTLAKEEISLSCNLTNNAMSEVQSSIIMCEFIELPFNYIYANTMFYYQDEIYRSRQKLLKSEKFESVILYYTIDFEPLITDKKQINIEFYVSENFFKDKKDKVSVKIKEIDLNSGVERSNIYSGNVISSKNE